MFGAMDAREVGKWRDETRNRLSTLTWRTGGSVVEMTMRLANVKGNGGNSGPRRRIGRGGFVEGRAGTQWGCEEDERGGADGRQAENWWNVWYRSRP